MPKNAPSRANRKCMSMLLIDCGSRTPSHGSLGHVEISNKSIILSFTLRKIVELEEELRVVGNNLKSLEVSEEKVYFTLTLVFESIKEMGIF